MGKSRLAIIGSSSLGRQLAGHAVSSGNFEVVGFFDDFSEASPEILGTVSAIDATFAECAFDCLTVGVGYKVMGFRHRIFDIYRERIPFAKIIHSSVIVDSTALVRDGAVLLANTVIDQRVTIGGNCFLSIAVTVSHDSLIGESSYLSPRVTVCGNCRIGKRVFLGAGSIIRDGVEICDDVVIGAGAVVLRNITVPGVYIGNPAKIMREGYYD